MAHSSNRLGSFSKHSMDYGYISTMLRSYTLWTALGWTRSRRFQSSFHGSSQQMDKIWTSWLGLTKFYSRLEYHLCSRFGWSGRPTHLAHSLGKLNFSEGLASPLGWMAEILEGKNDRQVWHSCRLEDRYLRSWHLQTLISSLNQAESLSWTCCFWSCWP